MAKTVNSNRGKAAKVKGTWKMSHWYWIAILIFLLSSLAEKFGISLASNILALLGILCWIQAVRLYFKK